MRAVQQKIVDNALACKKSIRDKEQGIQCVISADKNKVLYRPPVTLAEGGNARQSR